MPLRFLQRILTTQTASMRSYGILVIFFILVSGALLMVILGQKREMDLINGKNADFKKVTEGFYNRLKYEEQFKDSMENLVTVGLKSIKDLKTATNELDQEVEKKKTEGEACQAEQKTKKEEVESTDTANKKVADDLKAESGLWQKEIDTLKAQLTQYSQICNYIKDNPKKKELCGNSTSTQ